MKHNISHNTCSSRTEFFASVFETSTTKDLLKVHCNTAQRPTSLINLTVNLFLKDLAFENITSLTCAFSSNIFLFFIFCLFPCELEKRVKIQWITFLHKWVILFNYFIISIYKFLKRKQLYNLMKTD